MAWKKKGSRAKIQRGICSWYHNYLSTNPVYSPTILRRRFRVPLQLYRMFERDLLAAEPMLQEMKDGTGKLGASICEKFWFHYEGWLTVPHYHLSMTKRE